MDENESVNLFYYHNLGESIIILGLGVKILPANAGDTRDTGLIPRLGRSPGVGHGNLLQYSCLQNTVDCSPSYSGKIP